MADKNKKQMSDKKRADRLSALGVQSPEARAYSGEYSVFIRRLRVLLPLLAIAMVVVLFAWQVPDTGPLRPPEPDIPAVRAIGKNELLSPRFESTDDEGRPYVVTAKRALQGQSAEDDLVILEEPLADIALEDGRWLAVKAAQAAFRQETQRIFLKEDVEFFYDEGYRLSTQEMGLDMKAGTARTSVDVHVQGPKGTLDARGLDADRETGVLVFKGPARLVLKDFEGL